MLKVSHLAYLEVKSTFAISILIYNPPHPGKNCLVIPSCVRFEWRETFCRRSFCNANNWKYASEVESNNNPSAKYFAPIISRNSVPIRCALRACQKKTEFIVENVRPIKESNNNSSRRVNWTIYRDIHLLFSGH